MSLLKKLPVKRKAPAPAPEPETEPTEWSCPYVRFEEKTSCWEMMQMADDGLFMGTSVYIPKHVFGDDPPERVEIIIRRVG